MPDASTAAPAADTHQGLWMPEGGPRHKMLENDRCSRWLGTEVLTAEVGHAKLRMRIREEMTNGFDIAHGGMIFALADTCFAMACNNPAGDDATITVASGADINFMKSAKLGDEITAEAVRVTQTGRSGVYDVTVSRGEDTIAVFRGRSRTVPTPAQEVT